MPTQRTETTHQEPSHEPSNAEVTDRLLRAHEVQITLGMSRAKVYRLMKSGVLPTVRIWGSVRVPQNALRVWIDTNTQQGKR